MIRRLTNFAEWLWSPIATAESIEDYGTRGYILLGLCALVITGLIAWLGEQLVVTYLAEESATKEILLWVFESITRNPLPVDLPLIYLVLLAYLVVGFSRRLRIWSGRHFLDAMLAGLDVLINAGEWCIRHRWGAVGLVLVLITALTSGVLLQLRQAKETSSRKTQYSNWIEAGKSLMRSTSLDGGEQAAFQELVEGWEPKFRLVVEPAEYEAARKLYLIAEEVFDSHKPGEPWKASLRTHSNEFTRIYSELRGSYSQAIQTRQIEDLVRILYSRIFTRLGGETCSRLPDVVRAFEALGSISTSEFRSMAANTRGSLIACILIRQLRGESVIEGDFRGSEICASPFECLLLALKEYQESKNGAARCSVAERRANNNILTLKTKLALFYTSPIVRAMPKPDHLRWLRSQDALALEIKRDIGLLSSCNATPPFKALVFVTISEAYGAMALLGYDTERSLRSAGAFLELGCSFGPDDLHDWNLGTYCAAVEERQLHPAFREGLDTVSKGAVDDSYLLRLLIEVCS